MALASVACLLEIVNYDNAGDVLRRLHSRFAYSFSTLLPINLHAVIRRSGGEYWLHNLKHRLARV